MGPMIVQALKVTQIWYRWNLEIPGGWKFSVQDESSRALAAPALSGYDIGKRIVRGGEHTQGTVGITVGGVLM